MTTIYEVVSITNYRNGQAIQAIKEGFFPTFDEAFAMIKEHILFLGESANLCIFAIHKNGKLNYICDKKLAELIRKENDNAK